MSEHRNQSILKSILAASVLLLCSGFYALQAHAAVINIQNGGDPTSLDPHRISGDWENRIVGDIFEGLVTEDKFAQPIAGQATDWSISDDRLVYTFNLRDGIRWSDGTTVTAGDFVYAFQRLMDPSTGADYAYLQYTIKNAEAINSGELDDISQLGVKAVDDRTLKITLERPAAYFLGALTHWTAFPLPRHAIEKHGNDWVKIDNFVSNGPYRPIEWVPGSHVSTEKNPEYYDVESLAIDGAKFHVLEDQAAALKRYRAGEFDYLTSFPTDQFEWMNENLPGQAKVAPFAGLYFYAINNTKPPFDNADVRKALSMSINREVIGPQILGTGETPAYSWVPPGMANYPDPYTVDWKDMPYNEKVIMAKQLLQSAGYNETNRLSLQLRYNTDENHKRVAIAIAAMWKALGVDVELYNTETKVHYDELSRGILDIARAGWLADYNDADNFLNLLKSTTKYNYGRFKSAEFDTFINQANSLTDVDERAAALKNAEKIAMDESAAIPIYNYLSRNVVSERLTGFENNAFDIHRTRWLSFIE